MKYDVYEKLNLRAEQERTDYMDSLKKENSMEATDMAEASYRKYADPENLGLIQVDEMEKSKDEFKVALQEKKEQEFDSNKEKVGVETQKVKEQYLVKKKDEVWEQFINVSMGIGNLSEDQKGIYAHLGRKQGKEKELNKKASKYVKERVSILNNKRYNQEKKDRKLRELKEDTIKSITGYDEYVADMAFSRDADFKEIMEENDIKKKVGLTKLNQKKVEKIVEGRMQYEKISAQIVTDDAIAEINTLIETTQKSMDEYGNKRYELSDFDAICTETEKQIANLEEPSKSLGIITDKGEMEKTIKNARMAKGLLEIIDKMLRKSMKLGKQQSLKQQRTFDITMENHKLEQSENKLRAIVESEQILKNRWGIKDLVNDEEVEGEVEEKIVEIRKPITVKPRIAEEEFKGNLEDLSPKEKALAETIRKDIVVQQKNREAFEKQYGDLRKTNPEEYVQLIYRGTPGMAPVSMDSFQYCYDVTSERSLRVFAKVTGGATSGSAREKMLANEPATEQEQIASNIQVTNMKVLGKLQTNLFRTGSKRFANFKGFDHMNEDEMVKMIRSIGVGTLEREKTQEEIDAAKTAMKQIIDGQVSHYDYLNRKYGSILLELPFTQTLELFHEITRDLSITLDAATLVKEMDEFLDEKERLQLETCKSQMQYYAATERMLQIKLLMGGEIDEKQEDYIEAKAFEKQLFTKINKSVTEIDLNVKAEHPDLVYKRQQEQKLKEQVTIIPKKAEGQFAENLDGLNQKEAGYVKNEINNMKAAQNKIQERMEKKADLLDKDPQKYCENLFMGDTEAEGIGSTEFQNYYDKRSLKSFRVFARLTGGTTSKEAESKSKSGERCSEKEMIAESIQQASLKILGTPQANLLRTGSQRFANFMGFDHMAEDEMLQMMEGLSIGSLSREKNPEEIKAAKAAMKQFVDGQVSHLDYLSRKYGNNLLNIPLNQLMKIFPEVQRDLSIVIDAATLAVQMDALLEQQDKVRLETCKKQMAYYSCVLDIITFKYMGQDANRYEEAKVVELEIFNPKNKSVAEIDLNVKAEHPDVVYARQQLKGEHPMSTEEQKEWEEEQRLWGDIRQKQLENIKKQESENKRKDMEKEKEQLEKEREKLKGLTMEERTELVRKQFVEEAVKKVLDKNIGEETERYKNIKREELALGLEAEVRFGEPTKTQVGYLTQVANAKKEILNGKHEVIDIRTKEIAKKFADKKREELWNSLTTKPLKTQGDLEKSKKTGKLTREDEHYEALMKRQSGGVSLQEKIMLYKQGIKEINNKNYAVDKKERKLLELKEKTLGEIQGYDEYVRDMAFEREGGTDELKNQIKERGIDSEMNIICLNLNAAEHIKNLKVAYVDERQKLMSTALATNPEEAEKAKEGKTKEELYIIKNNYLLKDMKLENSYKILEEGDKAKTAQLIKTVVQVVNQFENIVPLGDSFNPAHMGNTIKEFERAKVLIDVLKKVENMDLNKDTYAMEACKAKLNKIVNSEQNILRRMEVKDFIIQEESTSLGEQEEKAFAKAKADIFKRMNIAREYKETHKNEEKDNPLKYFRDTVFQAQHGENMKVEYNDEVAKILRAYITAVGGNNSKLVNAKVRAGAELTLEEKRCKKLHEREFAGKEMDDIFFRAEEDTYSNFKGFSHMSEDELSKMFQDLGHTSENKDEEIDVNIKGITKFKEALLCHYDLFVRKYGTNFVELPKEEFINIFWEMQKDGQTTQVQTKMIPFLKEVMDLKYKRNPNTEEEKAERSEFEILEAQINFMNATIEASIGRAATIEMESDGEKIISENEKEATAVMCKDKMYENCTKVDLKAKVRGPKEIREERARLGFE